jgi:hypothetical protein
MTNKTHEQIFDTIGDSSITNEVYSRRDVLTKSGMGVAALALAGMPIGLAAITERAMAQSSSNVSTVLTLALKLEYLERAFYQLGLSTYGSSNLVAPFTPEESAAVTLIAAHEAAHVTLLSGLVSGVSPATYDWNGGVGGPFNPFAGTAAGKTDFFRLAQLFEDLGVRAYKGGAMLIAGDAAITTVFQIHSVEARHAARIRQLRGQSPYIPGGQSTLDAYGSSFDSTVAANGKRQIDYAIAVYGPEIKAAVNNVFPLSKGEDNRFITSSYAPLGYQTSNAEAWDEPLAATDVIAAVAPFGVS